LAHGCPGDVVIFCSAIPQVVSTSKDRYFRELSGTVGWVKFNPIGLLGHSPEALFIAADTEEECPMREVEITAVRYSFRLMREVVFRLTYNISEGPRRETERWFLVRQEEDRRDLESVSAR
jgi:hypothetical protein